MSLLEVEDLSVTFQTADGTVKAVQNSSFRVEAGQTLGVVGESGSGKSVSMQSLLGLARGGKVTGRALFRGDDLITMGPEQMRKIRGAQIAMVFQDPLSSLHPHYRVGDQVVEAILAHEGHMSKKDANARTIELFGLVGIPQPARRVHDYPHQFSGGMRQRVMIAMAMSLNPALLIADEPTTALDVTVQAQILELIAKLQAELGMAVIMITHDLGVVADIADEVMVMYAGRPVEKANRDTSYYRAHHPYTEGLLESIPVPGKTTELRPIPGQPPSLIQLPSGCSYHPRCRYAMDRCRVEVPDLYVVDEDPAHRSACFLPTTGDWRSARHRVEHEPEVEENLA
jgi:oligopeptide/dipeptide ABC transporter ATP-binding protein